MSDSAHPCHNLSNPAAQIFMCRHCMAKFYDPIQRWRHSKICKKATAKNGTDSVAVPSPTKRGSASLSLAISRNVEEAKSREEEIPQPIPVPPKKRKANTDSNLSCVICKKVFINMEEMKEHVRNPCNKPERVIPVGRPGGVVMKTNPQLILFENQLRQLEEAAKNGEENTCSQIESLLMAAQALQQHQCQQGKEGMPQQDLQNQNAFTPDVSEDSLPLSEPSLPCVAVVPKVIDSALSMKNPQLDKTPVVRVEKLIMPPSQSDIVREKSSTNPSVVQVSATTIRLRLPDLSHQTESQERGGKEDGDVETAEQSQNTGSMAVGEDHGRNQTGQLDEGSFTCELLQKENRNATGIKIMKKKIASMPVPPSVPVPLPATTSSPDSTTISVNKESSTVVSLSKESPLKISFSRNDKIFTRITKKKMEQEAAKESSHVKNKPQCHLQGCKHNELALKKQCSEGDDKSERKSPVSEDGNKELAVVEHSVSENKRTGKRRPVKAGSEGEQEPGKTDSVKLDTDEKEKKSEEKKTEANLTATRTSARIAQRRSSSISLTKNKKKKEPTNEKDEKSSCKKEKSSNEQNTQDSTKPKPNRTPKCRVCDKVFKNLDLLKKHNKVPCKVRLTRNLTQKVLRPKRTAGNQKAETKSTEKKVAKPVAPVEPKMKMLDRKFTDAGIEINNAKKTKAEKKPKRKNKVEYNFCITRSQSQKRAKWSVDLESLTDKERYFYGLGLVSIEQIPIKCASTVIKQTRTVSVEEIPEKETNELPPVLEKVVEVRRHIEHDIYILNDPIRKGSEPPPLLPLEEGKSKAEDSSNVVCRQIIEHYDLVAKEGSLSAQENFSLKSPLKSLEERHFLDAIGIDSGEGNQTVHDENKENSAAESNSSERNIEEGSSSPRVTIGLQTDIPSSTDKIMYPRPDFYRRFLKKMEKQRLKDEQEAKELKEHQDKDGPQKSEQKSLTDSNVSNIPKAGNINIFDRFEDQNFIGDEEDTKKDDPEVKEVIVYPKKPTVQEEGKENIPRLPYDPKRYEIVEEQSVTRSPAEEGGKVKYQDSRELMDLIAKTLGIFPPARAPEASSEDKPRTPDPDKTANNDEETRAASDGNSDLQLVVMNNLSIHNEHSTGIDVINVPKSMENQLMDVSGLTTDVEPEEGHCVASNDMVDVPLGTIMSPSENLAIPNEGISSKTIDHASSENNLDKTVNEKSHSLLPNEIVDVHLNLQTDIPVTPLDSSHSAQQSQTQCDTQEHMSKGKQTDLSSKTVPQNNPCVYKLPKRLTYPRSSRTNSKSEKVVEINPCAQKPSEQSIVVEHNFTRMDLMTKRASPCPEKDAVKQSNNFHVDLNASNHEKLDVSKSVETQASVSVASSSEQIQIPNIASSDTQNASYDSKILTKQLESAPSGNSSTAISTSPVDNTLSTPFEPYIRTDLTFDSDLLGGDLFDDYKSDSDLPFQNYSCNTQKPLSPSALTLEDSSDIKIPKDSSVTNISASLDVVACKTPPQTTTTTPTANNAYSDISDDSDDEDDNKKQIQNTAWKPPPLNVLSPPMLLNVKTMAASYHSIKPTTGNICTEKRIPSICNTERMKGTYNPKKAMLVNYNADKTVFENSGADKTLLGSYNSNHTKSGPYAGDKRNFGDFETGKTMGSYNVGMTKGSHQSNRTTMGQLSADKTMHSSINDNRLTLGNYATNRTMFDNVSADRPTFQLYSADKTPDRMVGADKTTLSGYTDKTALSGYNADNERVSSSCNISTHMGGNSNSASDISLVSPPISNSASFQSSKLDWTENDEMYVMSLLRYKDHMPYSTVPLQANAKSAFPGEHIHSKSHTFQSSSSANVPGISVNLASNYNSNFPKYPSYQTDNKSLSVVNKLPPAGKQFLNTSDPEIPRYDTGSRDIRNNSYESVYSDISDDSNDSCSQPKTYTTTPWKEPPPSLFNIIPDHKSPNFANTSFSDVSDDSLENIVSRSRVSLPFANAVVETTRSSLATKQAPFEDSVSNAHRSITNTAGLGNWNNSYRETRVLTQNVSPHSINVKQTLVSDKAKSPLGNVGGKGRKVVNFSNSKPVHTANSSRDNSNSRPFMLNDDSSSRNKTSESEVVGRGDVYHQRTGNIVALDTNLENKRSVNMNAVLQTSPVRSRNNSPDLEILNENSNDAKFAETLFDRIFKKDKNKNLSMPSHNNSHDDESKQFAGTEQPSVRVDHSIGPLGSPREILDSMHPDSCDSTDVSYIVIDKGVEICRTAADDPAGTESSDSGDEFT